MDVVEVQSGLRGGRSTTRTALVALGSVGDALPLVHLAYRLCSVLCQSSGSEEGATAHAADVKKATHHVAAVVSATEQHKAEEDAVTDTVDKQHTGAQVPRGDSAMSVDRRLSVSSLVRIVVCTSLRIIVNALSPMCSCTVINACSCACDFRQKCLEHRVSVGGTHTFCL